MRLQMTERQNNRALRCGWVLWTSEREPDADAARTSERSNVLPLLPEPDVRNDIAEPLESTQSDQRPKPGRTECENERARRVICPRSVPPT